MAVEWMSFIYGSVATIVLFTVIILAIIGFFLGKARTQIKFILKKLYSPTSLMLIALFDVVAAFDPSQTFLGLGVGPIAGIIVFLSEWGFHDKFAMKRIGNSLVEGLIAAIIVLIPLPVAGIFVAWFGVLGDKKKK